MKALFKLFRRFDARRIFGFIRRLGGMSRPKVKCYDLRSTHALRVEGDHMIDRLVYDAIRHFYPRPPGGGRPEHVAPETGRRIISIHALRVEGDINFDFLGAKNDDFYPRPPGGGRPPASAVPQNRWNFYPRPPGGGRLIDLTRCGKEMHFYPRPPGGGRHAFSQRLFARRGDFYPRPPGGGRQSYISALYSKFDFYPRPPGGGRRRFCSSLSLFARISIHALRVEGDA